MPAQQRIKLVFHAIQWVLFAEYDPFQGSIDRCRALVYDFVRRSRDADTARKQANFRNSPRRSWSKCSSWKKRASLLIHALGGLVAGGFLVGWAVLAVIL